MYICLLLATPNSRKSSTECEGHRRDEAIALREGSRLHRKSGNAVEFDF
jgi:hypothetical protein